MRTLCRVLVLGLAASVSLLMAGLINPGFETGDLTGWSASAGVSVGAANTCPPAMTPYNGTYFACLVAGSVGESATETALGLTAGTLAGLEPNLTGGSYLYQTVGMTLGETITEWVYFKANDDRPYNDFAYWSFVGPSTNTAGLIASISTVGHYGGTGWIPESFTAPSAGQYTIGFGVFNAVDSSASSYLGVDAVPEPGTLALLGLGLVGLCFRRRRA